MTRLALVTGVTISLIACSGAHPAQVSSPAAGAPAAPAEIGPQTGSHEETAKPSGEPRVSDAEEFKQNETETRGLDQGVEPSQIKPTPTETALKFTVLDKNQGPIPGIVIKLSNLRGEDYYTKETDAKGYAEVLVPVGQTYEVVYLSLGRREIAAKLPVSDKPNQTLRLVLRYKRFEETKEEEHGLVLAGVRFDTGKATLRPESYPKLDRVVEYMKHKPSVRIEISGHTDNVGSPKSNKSLSKNRAQSCRKYLISQGIDGGRIQAVGYGEERPIASNDTPHGRQKNRRIEATEL